MSQASEFHVTATPDKKPLRYAFVSHQSDFVDPMYALTNGDGVARFPNIDESATVDGGSRVHAQTVAVRMLDGTTASSSEKSLRLRNKAAGARLNVSRRDASFAYFQIMERCYDVYETVFRPIAAFSGQARRFWTSQAARRSPQRSTCTCDAGSLLLAAICHSLANSAKVPSGQTCGRSRKPGSSSSPSHQSGPCTRLRGSGAARRRVDSHPW